MGVSMGLWWIAETLLDKIDCPEMNIKLIIAQLNAALLILSSSCSRREAAGLQKSPVITLTNNVIATMPIQGNPSFIKPQKEREELLAILKEPYADFPWQDEYSLDYSIAENAVIRKAYEETILKTNRPTIEEKDYEKIADILVSLPNEERFTDINPMFCAKGSNYVWICIGGKINGREHQADLVKLKNDQIFLFKLK